MRLKNLLLIAVMLFTAVGASAQFHASVRAGATATTLGEQKIKMGLRAGVGAEYLFSDRWGVRSGLFYTMKGATTSKDVFCYDPLKTTKLSYLDIPFEAQVSFGLSQKSRLAVHAGPYLACLLHSSVPENAGHKIRRMEAGVGLGVDFTVGHFIVGPEIQYGLTRVNKSGSDHNICYAITLGYRF